MEEVAYIGGKYKPINGKGKINDIVLNGKSLVKNRVVDLTSLINEGVDSDVFEIVDVLPTEDIKSKIYCVLNEDKTKYVEWVYANNSWKTVGEFSAEPSLSEYAKTSDVNTVVNNINTTLNSKIEDSSIEDETEYDDIFE